MHFYLLGVLSFNDIFVFILYVKNVFFQFIEPIYDIWRFLMVWRIIFGRIQATFSHELGICHFFGLKVLFLIFIRNHIIIFFECSLGCAISRSKSRLTIEHLVATHGREIRFVLYTFLSAIVLNNLHVGTCFHFVTFHLSET